MSYLDHTHDPETRSWEASAGRAGGSFPIQNLPLCVFRRRDSGESWRGGVGIGDRILDALALRECGILDGQDAELIRLLAAETLQPLMGVGRKTSTALRHLVFDLLLEGGDRARKHVDVLRTCLLPQADVEYALPSRIGNFTDFFTSIHHAEASARPMRPGAPLTPNFKHMPIAYHGRASSVRVSGDTVVRPNGQYRTAAGDVVFGSTVKLDYELELGVFIGQGNARGAPVSLAMAEDHIFGVCLLNDWSARDIQGWESTPLGPFLAKNFATTISPWIVTLQALEPFRVPTAREDSAPAMPAYLANPRNHREGGFDIRVEAYVTQDNGDMPLCRTSTSFRHQYWTLAQMVAHHTVGGCNLEAGDLLGTGTISGPSPEEAGCILEQIAHATGQSSPPAYLHDGDVVRFEAWCEKPGATRIGFGQCVGKVAAAVEYSILV